MMGTSDHSVVGKGIFQHPRWAALPLALFLDQIICPGQELNEIF